VAGFGYALSETVITNTDDRGIATAEFNLSVCGGDHFRVVAGRQAGSPEVATGTLTVWRKLWYELDTMNKAAPRVGHFSLQHQDLIKSEFEKVFVDVEVFGRENRLENQRVVDGDALVAGLGAEYFGADKAPYQAHLVTIDHFAEKKNVDVTYEADKMVYLTPPTGPFHGYGEDDRWFVKAIYKEEGQLARYLDGALVSLDGTSEDYNRRIKVDFSTTTIRPTPEQKVSVKLYTVHSEERWGGAYGHRAHIAMGAVDDYGAELLGPAGIARQILITVVHELAHLFAMVPTGTPSYVNTGPGQDHCSDTRCLMFMSEHEDSTGNFCVHCIKAFRKTDLSRFTHKFEATKGAKA